MFPILGTERSVPMETLSKGDGGSFGIDDGGSSFIGDGGSNGLGDGGSGCIDPYTT